jgi:hypothetical protein
MDRSGLVGALSVIVPKGLAEELVDEFLMIRQDLATGTLGRSAPGKFVETVVQALQHVESGKYASKPNVDDYLSNLDARASTLPDGLRFCAGRIGRAAYTLRNKRNIAHKGSVDPNAYDLRFTHAAAQWILAELLRVATNDSMEKAGKLIDQVLAPVGGLVEDFGDKRLVLEDVPARDEILLLLHHAYPNAIARAEIAGAMVRRDPSTVRKAIRSLWEEKMIEEVGNECFKLTQRGFSAAIAVVREMTLR